jgi:diacylglycerol kinase
MTKNYFIFFNGFLRPIIKVILIITLLTVAFHFMSSLITWLVLLGVLFLMVALGLVYISIVNIVNRIF